MTNPNNTNPPAKTVQGLPEGTLRTTMTHTVAGDLVMVQTITADPESHWVPAPAKPTKRAQWARVQGHEMVGLVVILESTGERIALDYTGHTAITIRDRETGQAEESGPTVTITGTNVHREARGGRAWCPVPVLDGDEITGDAARVTCPVCAVADSVSAEVVADAVYSYELNCYVVYMWDADAGRSVPVPVAELGAVPRIDVTDTVLAPLAGLAVVDVVDVRPVTAPATLAQRQAVRLLVELEPSGATPQVNAGLLKRLQSAGWLTHHRATRTVTLAQMARDWVAGEHTAEVTTIVHGGVTLYGATCNCGTGHENPRMARRVPWTSAMLTTPEDAVAVALGHGEVSRPRYKAPEVLAVGDRVEVLGDWTQDGQALPGVVTLLDSSAVWVEHAEGCAPLAYGAEQLRRVPLGETLAAQEAVLDLPAGRCVHCQQAVLHAHGLWIAGGAERCAENLSGPHEVHLHRCEWTGKPDPRVIVVPGCGMCELESQPEISVTDARITADTVAAAAASMVAGERSLTPTADDVAHMTGDPIGWVDGMLTGEPRTARGVCGGCGADGDVHDAECLTAGPPRGTGDGFVDDELMREHLSQLALREELAALPPVEKVVSEHVAGLPWTARGAKRKASSKTTRRTRQLAGAR